jgi:hypothetical protein
LPPGVNWYRQSPQRYDCPPQLLVSKESTGRVWMDTNCISVLSASISTSLSSGAYRIFGEFNQKQFIIPHDELAVERECRYCAY